VSAVQDIPPEETKDPPGETQDPPRRARPKRKNSLGPDSMIGSRLRELYREFESEPIPTQLVSLLEQLDEAERKGGK
jgi:hypothetical protein